MGIYEHATHFAGLPVVDWGPGRPLRNPDRTAYRLSLDFEETEAGAQWSDRLASFLEDPASGQVRAIVVGIWGGESYVLANSSAVVEALVAARDRLPNLRGLFLGDIIQEENEISWIEQSDVTPVLEAYPLLEEFGVRGGTGLRFPAVRHQHLRTLCFEAGGLPGEVVRGVAASELPALEYLEMWLGVEEYGGDATVADLAPLLAAGRFPALRHLGLRNSEIQDEIAAAVAGAPVVAQLRSLDLSLGVLTDEGVTALLGGQPLTHLTWLDLRHNFVTEPVARRIREALEPSGVEVDLSERGEAWEDDGVLHRFTAVAE